MKVLIDDKERPQSLAAYQEARLVPEEKTAGVDIVVTRGREDSLYGGMSGTWRNKGSKQTG
jgi:hypothetical protein